MKPSEIERQYAAQEAIVERGSTSRELYVIRSGEVRLEGADPERSLLLGPGDMFGEIAAILGEPNSARAVAESDVTVLVLGVALLNRLCVENADFSFRLIRHLAERVANPGESAPSLEPSDDLSELAQAILRRTATGDCPALVDGLLGDLSKDAGLPVIDTYMLVQSLLEKRVLRLAEDRLSLLERDKLEAISS